MDDDELPHRPTVAGDGDEEAPSSPHVEKDDAELREEEGNTPVFFLDNEVACLCLSRTTPLRRVARRIVASRQFEIVVLVSVILSAVVLGLVDYRRVNDNPQSERFEEPRTTGWRNRVVELSDWVFGIFFTVECVLKIMASGFRGSPRAYTGDRWNCFDFFLVVTWLLEVVLENLLRVRHGLSFGGIRIFRLLRPLRTISTFPKLKRVATGIALAAPQLASLLGFLCVVFVVFCTAGVVLFGDGAQHGRCRLTPYPVTLDYDRSVHGTNYSAFRCLDRRDTFGRISHHPRWSKSDSPWKEARDCYWPLDDGDTRLCSLGNNGQHECARHTRRIEHVDWRWCGSDFDAKGNRRFKRTELFSSYFVAGENPYFYPSHSPLWNLNGVGVDPATWNQRLRWGFMNYDNLLRAVITNFVIISLEGWKDILAMIQDASGETLGGIYVYLLIIFGALAGINIFIAVLEEAYTRASLLESASVRLRAASSRDERRPPDSFSDQPSDRSSLACSFVHWRAPPSSWFTRILESGVLEVLAAVAIVITLVCLSMFHRHMPDQEEFALSLILSVCHIFFLFECVVKMAVLSPAKYWSTTSLIFDGTISIWAIVEVVLMNAVPGNTRSRRLASRRFAILSTVRLSRVLRVVDSRTVGIAESNACLSAIGFPKFAKVLTTALVLIWETLRDVVNILLLLAVFSYSYALLGMQLFANRLYYGPSYKTINVAHPWFDGALGRYANFDTIGNALVTIYLILIGDKFTELFSALWRGSGAVAVIYTLTLVFFGRWILLNLFLSILLSNAARIDQCDEIERDSQIRGVTSLHELQTGYSISRDPSGMLRTAEGSLLFAVCASLDETTHCDETPRASLRHPRIGLFQNESSSHQSDTRYFPSSPLARNPLQRRRGSSSERVHGSSPLRNRCVRFEAAFAALAPLNHEFRRSVKCSYCFGKENESDDQQIFHYHGDESRPLAPLVQVVARADDSKSDASISPNAIAENGDTSLLLEPRDDLVSALNPRQPERTRRALLGLSNADSPHDERTVSRGLVAWWEQQQHHHQHHQHQHHQHHQHQQQHPDHPPSSGERPSRNVSYGRDQGGIARVERVESKRESDSLTSPFTEATPRRRRGSMYKRGRARQSIDLMRRCVRRFAESKGRRAGTGPDFAYVFKIFDHDKSGAITIDELKRGTLALDVRLNDRQLKLMIEVVDADGDGVISYAEFLHFFGPRASNFHERLVEGEIELLQNMRVQETSSMFLGGEVKAQFADGSMWAFASVFPLEPGKSLGLFSPTSNIRLSCARLAEWPYFERIILFLVGISCIALILDAPLMNPKNNIRRVAIWLDSGLTVIFVGEVAIKVVASGLYTLGPRAYLRSGFNVLDVIAVGSALTYDVFTLLTRYSTSGDSPRNGLYLRILNAARVLRATRALRAVRFFSGLRKLIEAFAEALPNILQVGLIVLLMLYISAILFRTLLEGHLETCKGPGATDAYLDYDTQIWYNQGFRKILRHPRAWNDVSNETKDLFGPGSSVPGYAARFCTGFFDNEDDWVAQGRPYPCCVAGGVDGYDNANRPTPQEVCRCFGYSWGKDQPARFDNLVLAMKALMAVATGSIADLMFAATAIRGRHDVSKADERPIWYFFCIAFQVVASLVFFNLFVASTVEAFITIRKRRQLQADESLFVTSEQQTWAEHVKRVMDVQPEIRLKHRARTQQKRIVGLWWVTTTRFNYALCACVCLDFIVLSTTYFGQPDSLTTFLEMATYASHLVFNTEVVLKILALSWAFYTASFSNCFDFALVFVGDAVLVFRLANAAIRRRSVSYWLQVLETLPRLLRVVRIARLAKHARHFESPRRIIQATVHLAPALAYMLLLVFVGFFVFSIIGVQLFSTVAFHGANDHHMNFRSLGSGFMTVLMLATNESWDRWMSAAAHRTSGCRNYPEWDRNICGFRDRPGCDIAQGDASEVCLEQPGATERDCINPLNGCGTQLSYVYVLIFMVCMNFVLTNLFIGVILESFKTSKAKSEAGDKTFFSSKVVRDFMKRWSRCDPRGTGEIKRADLRNLLEDLGEPLGFGKTPDERERLAKFWEREYAPYNHRRRSRLVSSRSSRAMCHPSFPDMPDEDEDEDEEATSTFEPENVPDFSEIGNLILDVNDATLIFQRLKDRNLFHLARTSSITDMSAPSVDSRRISTLDRRRTSLKTDSNNTPLSSHPSFNEHWWFPALLRKLLCRCSFFSAARGRTDETQWLRRVGSIAGRKTSRHIRNARCHIHDVLLSLVTEMRFNTIMPSSTIVHSSTHADKKREKEATKRMRENEAFMLTVIAIAQLDLVPFNTRNLVLANLHCTPDAIGHRIARHRVSIRTLDMHGTALSGMGTDVLCDALEHVGVNYLRVVQLAKCEIGSPGLRSIAQVLHAAPSLVHLDVSSNDLDCLAISPLAMLVESLVAPERLERRFALFVGDNPRLTKQPRLNCGRHGMTLTRIVRDITALAKSFDVNAIIAANAEVYNSWLVERARTLARSSADWSLSLLAAGRLALSLRGCALGDFFVQSTGDDDEDRVDDNAPDTTIDGTASVSSPAHVLIELAAAPFVCIDLASNNLSDVHAQHLALGLLRRSRRLLRFDLRNNPHISVKGREELMQAGLASNLHRLRPDVFLFGQFRPTSVSLRTSQPADNGAL
ncbi:hypothetical protein CTAYLR_000277 [Chrysophaeum taylorii]|uniref:EF-hand domain-containing protein n=1 Tax=Chrysophaeum taylorii TaxID=2483200 RepID=A0AAD7XM40_9STRA|nr:hypothetical protein CTAYLR_000277 [Chrysophaeum taylorii]